VLVVGKLHAQTTPHRATQLFWGMVGCVACVLLAVARQLTPDPSGFGTHTQLGLPPCGFLLWTSLPCPACGLTTAFAHMARLEITLAANAHPLGVPLFALTVLAVPVAVWACACACPIADTSKRLRAGPLAAMIVVAALLSWIARVAAIVSA
jgi:hypothetical protein